MHVALATRRGHPEINIVAQFLSPVARPLHHVSWRHCSPLPRCRPDTKWVYRTRPMIRWSR